MDQFRTATASSVCVVAISILLAVLAMSSSSHDRVLKAEVCDYFQRTAPVSQSPLVDAGKIPTLAPPRADALSITDKSIRTLSHGQVVYVQVKADSPEIEVGWVPGESLGR
jgi:hypothetical protein